MKKTSVHNLNGCPSMRVSRGSISEGHDSKIKIIIFGGRCMENSCE